MSRKNIQLNKNRGAALLIFTLLFLFTSVALVFGIGRGAYQDIIRYRTLSLSKESFFAAESGIEDAIYRHRDSKTYTSPNTFTIDGVDVNVVRKIASNHFLFTVTADVSNIVRKEYLDLGLGNGTSFSYGLQSDTGGIVLENSSSVLGNIYSNGTVEGTGASGGNMIYGTIVSAGSGGYVEGVHATGSVYAHDLDTVVVDKNAYCDSITNSDVSGDLYCNSISSTIVGGTATTGPATDQPTSTLPLSDSDIATQEANASVNVIASTDPECAGGTYTIDSDTSLGPAKIECNVLVDKSSTNVTLTGVLWIEGNLTTKSGPTFTIDPALTNQAIPIIIDNPSNRSSSSQITLRNSAIFKGAGDHSYVLLISQNDDQETGGSNYAIDSGQSASGDVLLYAKHGEIIIEQSGGFVGVAALLIRLQNSAQIVYKTGAISLQFPDGPSGGFVVSEWREIAN